MSPKQDFTMKTWSFLLVVYLHGTLARLHTLKYFYTGSLEVPNFPEFVAVGLVDDVQMFHYDSNIRRLVPKQDWMDKVVDPQYLDRQTQTCFGHQQWFKANIGILKDRLNHTGDVHIAQVMYGCEWDDETEAVGGFTQVGFDGEDFMVFDLKTETWIAAKPQAFLIKQEWDRNKAWIAERKNYLIQICPEWLKKFVDYGKKSLMRTDFPSVSLLQKTSSSPIRCFATGFYPDRAMMFWRRDGVEVHEDVDHGEILPNQDGTFQMSVDLDFPSAKVEDWGRLDCVFQLSGVKEVMVTRLDGVVLKNNEGTTIYVKAGIIGVVVVVAVVVLVCLYAARFFNFKKEYAVNSPEVFQLLNPKR